jgi:uncharacterized protein (DUF433 family)
MAAIGGLQTTVVRTDRGLSITGTRVTVYEIMDYLAAGWPAGLIRDRLQLTESQMSDALAYIEAHRAEVKAEYETVLRIAEENRQYWNERGRERLAQIASRPKTDHPELRAKLRAWEAKREQY